MNAARISLLVASCLAVGACSSSSAATVGATGDAAAPPSGPPVADSGAAPQSDAAVSEDDAGQSPTDAGTLPEAGTSTNVRGLRYCEILAAKLSGTNVHVDVYSTYGLNDCPDAQWTAINASAVATQLGVSQALLNGPRYWMMDTLQGTLVSTTVVTIGGIPMHQAGAIDTTYSPTASLGTPYVTHQIQRNTVVTFAAGRPVFELVDPQGKIYDMQSYSTQKVAQTQASLATLGSVLKPPTGWSFRTRTLTADLVLTTPGGIGVVVQDDDDNTYQQSQQ